jgi:cystathionine beta-synthase
MFVAGAGTGGTIAGVGKLLKEKCPGIIIVGGDPYGSILALPQSKNATDIKQYQIEGIGYDFIPEVLDRSVVDEWYKTEDKSSFLMARRLIREEGLLCGGSAGSAMVVALQAARKLKKGQRCVVLLADSTRNYMSKFLSDSWMKEHGFTDEVTEKAEEKKRLNWGGATINDLNLLGAVTVPNTTTCKECVSILESKAFNQLPVTTTGKKLIGMVTLGQLLSKLAHGLATPSSPVSEVMFSFESTKYQKITMDTRLESLSEFFEKHSSAVVTDGEEVVGVVTKIDLVGYLMKKKLELV